MADTNINFRFNTEADTGGVEQLEGALDRADQKAQKVSVRLSNAARPTRISDAAARIDIAKVAEEAQKTALRAFSALSKSKAGKGGLIPKEAIDSFSELSDILKDIDPVNVPKAASAIADLEKSLGKMSGLPLKYAQKQLDSLKKSVNDVAKAGKVAAAEMKGSFSGGELVSSVLSGDIKGIADQLFNLLGTVKKFPGFLKGIGQMGVGQLAIIYAGIQGFQKVFDAWLERMKMGIRMNAEQSINGISDGMELAAKKMERFAFVTDLANGKLQKQIETEKTRRQAFEAIAAAQTDREEAEALTGATSASERNAIEQRFRGRRERAAEEAERAELSESRRADEANYDANAAKIEARKRSIAEMQRVQAQLGALEARGMDAMSKGESSYFARLKEQYGLSEFSADDVETMKELRKRVYESIVAANDSLQKEEADQEALADRIAQYAVQEKALAEKEVANAAARAKAKAEARRAEEAVLVEQKRRERDLRLEEERTRESAADAESERGMGLNRQMENAERRAKDRAGRFAEADKAYRDFMASLGDRAENENRLTDKEKSRRDDLRAQRTKFLGEMLDTQREVADKKYEMENALRRVGEEKTDRDYAQREADIEAEQQARIRRGGTMAQFKVAQENVARREEELATRRAERDALRAELQKKYGPGATLASLGSEDRSRWDRAVNRVIETTNNLRSARSELDSMSIERQKAITGQMLQGTKQSNRLTAMGLAGDVSQWNRETARNTGRMVSLLERNLGGGRSRRPEGGGWSLYG